MPRRLAGVHRWGCVVEFEGKREDGPLFMADEGDLALKKCFLEIPEADAREEALSLLAEEWTEVPGDFGLGRARWKGLTGLTNASRICKWEFDRRHTTPSGIGYAALSKELEELALSMRKTAGQLRKLSPTALEWVGILPFAGIAEGVMPHADGRIRPMLEKRVEANAGEAFPVQEYWEAGDGAPWPIDPKPEESVLARRLSAIAEVLDFLQAEADRAKVQRPGARQVFDPPAADFGIFRNVAQVLRERGRTLAHLRPIACAFYRWGTGEEPSASWAERQEKEARAEHTP